MQRLCIFRRYYLIGVLQLKVEFIKSYPRMGYGCLVVLLPMASSLNITGSYADFSTVSVSYSKTC